MRAVGSIIMALAALIVLAYWGSVVPITGDPTGKLVAFVVVHIFAVLVAILGAVLLSGAVISSAIRKQP